MDELSAGWAWKLSPFRLVWHGVGVLDIDAVVEHVLKRARAGASRSSGPGGQHRDKASTRAELTVDCDSLAGLDSGVAERLAERLGLDDRPLRILIQDERSLARNREIAAQRLAELVAGALAVPPPPRRPTRPGRAVREARLTEKSRRATVKRQRRAPPIDA